MTTLKAWLYLGALLACIAGFLCYGAHERSVGAAGVQSAWNAAKSEASDKAAAQAYATAQTQYGMSVTFAGIAASYHESITNAKPSLAPVSATDVSSGRVRLRPEWQCAAGYVRAGTVPQAAASIPGADAGAAAAAEQRSQGASDLVSAADAADGRESALDKLVVALQATLYAERNP